MSVESEITRLTKAKQNFQIALDYHGVPAEEGELFSDYPDHIKNLPFFMVPEEVNYNKGYIDQNGWHYQAPSQGVAANPIDIYKINQGHSYFVMLGENIGTRFRVCTVLEQDDIRNKTSGIYKDMALSNENAPKGSWPVMSYTNPNYSNAKTPFFTAANDGWLLIQKDNASATNIMSYVFDIDTPLTIQTDTDYTLDENLFDISNGVITLKQSVDKSTISGRKGVPETVGGQTVTGIGNYCFDECYNLAAIELPSTVVSIGDYAFAETALISFDMPTGITTIGNYAFYKCTGLRGSAVIPNTVVSMGFNVYDGCSRLETATINAPLTTLTGTFQNTKITGLTLSNTITTLDGVLLGNISIKNLPRLQYVTTLTNGAFQGCTSVTSVTIPNSVTTIGPNVFKGCTGLTSVTMTNTVPPTMYDSSAFENTNDCPIYVPSSAVETYKAATGWSDLSSRIFATT